MSISVARQFFPTDVSGPVFWWYSHHFRDGFSWLRPCPLLDQFEQVLPTTTAFSRQRPAHAVFLPLRQICGSFSFRIKTKTVLFMESAAYRAAAVCRPAANLCSAFCTSAVVTSVRCVGESTIASSVQLVNECQYAY